MTKTFKAVLLASIFAVFAIPASAALVKVKQMRKNAVIRRMADRDKKAVNCDIALISVLIGHGDAGKLALTVQGGYAAIEHELDIVLGFERLDELCFTAEGVSAVDKIHPAACVGKEHCVLKRRVSAAVHGNGATLVKRTVTHGAEANSAAAHTLTKT